MVCVGDTDMLPDPATVPMPLSMVTLVALLVLQVRVALWPLVIEDGFAVRLTVMD